MTSVDMKPTIRTFSGRTIDFLKPDPAEICIEDISQGLSQCCRFACQTRKLYSVAEHSLLVLDLVKREVLPDRAKASMQLALLHDASEAYTGDMSAPLKTLCPDFKAVEKRLEAAVAIRFKLSDDPRDHMLVKACDLQARALEGAAFMPGREDEYGMVTFSHAVRVDVLTYHLKAAPPPVIRQIFMQAFHELFA
jgi:hypothetical protein